MKYVFLIFLALVTPAYGVEKVVCFGDSNTQGYGVAVRDNWCSQLGELPGIDTVNLGVRSDDSSDGLARFDTALAIRPKTIIIMLDTGDAYLHNDGRVRNTVAGHEKNIRMMLKKAQKRNIRVILMTAIPTTSPEYNARLKPYILNTQEIAKNCNLLFVNNYGPTAEAMIEGESLFIDWAHMNELGHAYMFERLRKVIKQRR